MKRILILGASGFLGTHLALAMRDRYRVIGTYDHHPIRIDGILPFRLQLHNPEEVKNFIERFTPDTLLYCVAERREEKCRQFQSESFYLNAELASICASTVNRWKGKFIFFSSTKIFSGEKGFYNEEDRPHPISVYGNTKFRAEQLLENLDNVFILRMGTLFGWGNRHHESLFNKILQKLWRGESSPYIQDELRSFISVADAVSAVQKVMEAPFEQAGMYHLSVPERESYYQFAKCVAENFLLSSDLVRPVDGKLIGNDGFTQETRGIDVSLDGSLFNSTFNWSSTPMAEAIRNVRRQLYTGQF